MVAKVTVGETTTYTADLADALNKAANGTTITLLADTEISAYVNIYAETATGADQMVVTLDLAGHTVTSSYKPIVIGADRNITASYYGTLKIVGTGNITLEYATLNAEKKAYWFDRLDRRVHQFCDSNQKRQYERRGQVDCR